MDVSDLSRSGRFREALKLLTRESDRKRHTLLLAELLHLVGENEKAESLLSTKFPVGTTPIEFARRFELLGSIAVDRGDAPTAVEMLNRSLALARKSDNIEQISRAQLKLLPILTDTAEFDRASALSLDLRRNVLRSGDPHLLALVHLRVGQIEAKRGLLDRAVRHLDAGRRLLEIEANVWIAGLINLDRSAVFALRGDSREALASARDALMCAENSGHERTRVGALANLTLLCLQIGSIDQARTYLDVALAAATPFARVHAALLDTHAQLALLSGDVSGADAALREFDGRASGLPTIRASWTHLAANVTRLRLMLERGELSSALNLAESCIAIAANRGDTVLGAMFRMLKSRTLLAAHDLERASHELADALQLLDDRLVPVRAEIEICLAEIAAQSGHTAAADIHRHRAERYARLVGDVWSQRSFARSFQMSQSLQTPPELQDEQHDAGVLLDRLCMNSAASIVSLGPKPELLAMEAAALLSGLKCTDALSVVAVEQTGREAVTEIQTPKVGTLKDIVVSSAGMTQSRRHELRAVYKNDPSSKATVLAVQRLVTAARELHAFRQAEKERTSLWPVEADADTAAGIVASAVMRDLYEMVDRLARADVPVLVLGETGVGKELVSRELHRRGHPASAPFVAYNCSAVPKDMLDAQLFGHKRGAFTGAHENFPGVIRAAAGGTLLLDEIGELSLDIQPKLLRFLESGEIHPIGEPRPLKIDVRIVAATNADLDRLVREGRFREDLFYRLNVVPLRVPPLRERREEIPALTEHFLERYAHDMRKTRLRMSDETLEYLVLYRWPGNVRQLANEIRRVVALAPGGAELVPAMLSDEIRASRRTIDASQAVAGPNEMVIRVDQPLSDAVAQLEWTMIERALAHGGDRLEDAASALGISRKGLFLKRRRLGLLRRAARRAAASLPTPGTPAGLEA